jgi:hypothetical protein
MDWNLDNAVLGVAAICRWIGFHSDFCAFSDIIDQHGIRTEATRVIDRADAGIPQQRV